MEVFGLTDPGRHRSRNEDAILYPPLTLDVSGEKCFLLAVADGVGGSPAGEVASRAAIDTLQSTKSHSKEDRCDLLRRLFADANAAVAQQALDSGRPGMATTLVAALVSETRLWVANVGDSRAYLVSRDGIRRLTEDHTWVAERVKAGYMSEAEASQSPQRNLITRSLGGGGPPEADVYGPCPFVAGDCVVLCSDGLYAMVTDGEIGDMCRRLPVEEAVRELVALANDRGGPDNISVIVMQPSHS